MRKVLLFSGLILALGAGQMLLQADSIVEESGKEQVQAQPDTGADATVDMAIEVNPATTLPSPEETVAEKVQNVESVITRGNTADTQKAEVPAAPADVVPAAIPQDSEAEAPAAKGEFRYVLGVDTTSIPPLVRAHVDLPPKNGLFVHSVMPGSAAEKAGVKQYDVIAAFNGKGIQSNEQLVEAIQQGADKPQTVTILRGGKELHLTVTAEKVDEAKFVRPRGLRFMGPGPVIPSQTAPGKPATLVRPRHGLIPPAPADDSDLDFMDENMRRVMQIQRQHMEQMRQRMEAMEEAMRQNMPGFKPFKPFSPMHPGPVMNPPIPQQPAPMQIDPNNPNVKTDAFSIRLEKNGDAPASIKINDNGNQYEVDENSIDQLPEDVRNRINIGVETEQ